MDDKSRVVFLNPRTCGIYKSGLERYKTDSTTGRRTSEIDNELLEHVMMYLDGKSPPGLAAAPWDEVLKSRVLVPTYYDPRYVEGINKLLKDQGLSGVTLGELLDNGILSVRGGHGSPSNDQRTGTIPYIKVSDIRALRINVNPTNLVSEVIAQRLWRASVSGLQAWDVITPNRASSNIGEFAILLPGEEQVVLTKEVFVFRIKNGDVWDPFSLLWALSLRQVRDQWRRVALMQTNREDCGERYREVVLPSPRSKKWAQQVSSPFRDYFRTLAEAKAGFAERTSSDGFEYVPTVRGVLSFEEASDDATEDESQSKG